MTLTNTKTEGMKYELDKVDKKKVSDPKRALIKEAEQLSTLTLLWVIVKRHKVGLLLIGNIILVLNYVFPAWFTFLTSLIGK